MADDVESVTLDVLKNIRAGIAELRIAMQAGFDEIRSQGAKGRRSSAGTRVMMRATASEFDLRVRTIEARA